MGKPKAPAPPNPVSTASAQNSTGINTGIANAFLQNPTQINPYGTSTMDPTGSFTWYDPYTKANYTVPRFTSETKLTPTGQALFDLNLDTDMNLATLARDQSGSLIPYFNSRVDLSTDALNARGLPTLDMAGLPGPGENFDNSLDAIQEQMGGPFAFSGLPDIGPLQLGNEATEARLFDLGSNRLNERFDRDQARLEQSLADRGIALGSDAYSNAMDDFGRTKNDAYNQLMLTGRELASGELKDEWASRMGLRDTLAGEQMQAWGANQGLRGQAFSELMGGAGTDLGMRSQLANELLKQFDADMATRSGAMTEQITERQQPLKEIGIMAGTAAPDVPNFGSPTLGAIPTTDVAGIINQDFANRMGVYNTEMNNWNSMWGGLLGMGGTLGGALIKKSDIRAKEDIEHLGTAENGLPVYAFRYKGETTRRVGHMAHEVAEVAPEAVSRGEDGYLMVDYGRLYAPGHPMLTAIHGGANG